jgi:hypothetical protein
MPDYAESSGAAGRGYILRSVVGFFAGGAGGALLGAAVFILLVGPREYTRGLGDDSLTGIISAGGTHSDFTRAMTYAFACCGAVVGAPLGFIAGLFTTPRNPPAHSMKAASMR